MPLKDKWQWELQWVENESKAQENTRLQDMPQRGSKRTKNKNEEQEICG